MTILKLDNIPPSNNCDQVSEALTWKSFELQAYITALHWAGEITLPPKDEQYAWEAALKKTKAERGRPHSLHTLETMADRSLFFTRMIELTGEWLNKGGDDEWLRGWESKWNVLLLEGAKVKSAYYDREVPVSATVAGATLKDKKEAEVEILSIAPEVESV